MVHGKMSSSCFLCVNEYTRFAVQRNKMEKKFIIIYRQKSKCIRTCPRSHTDWTFELAAKRNKKIEKWRRKERRVSVLTNANFFFFFFFCLFVFVGLSIVCFLFDPIFLRRSFRTLGGRTFIWSQFYSMFRDFLFPFCLRRRPTFVAVFYAIVIAVCVCFVTATHTNCIIAINFVSHSSDWSRRTGALACAAHSFHTPSIDFKNGKLQFTMARDEIKTLLM